MENLDDSENPAKISDSAYSNSCSNSQSRRSHSSKSTHSGSNSSGSSGYGGKQSTSGSSNNIAQPKKDKEPKKKKETTDVEVIVETEPEPPVIEVSKEETPDVCPNVAPVPAQNESSVENTDVTADPSIQDEVGFSCVISMHDGIVIYTTISITTTLGFPKDMWIGRSFIDFVHPKDRNTFADQMTKKLAGPKSLKDEFDPNSISTMACRIRRYRGLVARFDVKETTVTFMPFLLHFFFKNLNHGETKVIYLIIQAKPFFPAFKTPYEKIKGTPFVMRHAANGRIEYVDHEIVSYMGYLPQDIIDKNALLLYHPEDLEYLCEMYETIMKLGGLKKSKPYRMITQNGSYVKLETEWSIFINPWSSKLEFVTGKHVVLEGPGNPDIFNTVDLKNSSTFSEEEKNKANTLRNNIITILNEMPKKTSEIVKEQMSKRQDLISFMENLIKEQLGPDEEMQDTDNTCFERDSVMLGGISPHHDCSDSKSSTATPLSYNQLNYNETLHRYFERQDFLPYENYDTAAQMSSDPENKPGPFLGHGLRASAKNTSRSSDTPSSCDSKAVKVASMSPPAGEDYQPIRLTESILSKHNSVKEKELLEVSRAARSGSKGEREKVTNEKRQKKKEHLARFNATYQPTSAGDSENQHSQGVKRALKIESENTSNKHHCSGTRPSRRKRRSQSPSSDVEARSFPGSAAPTANQWTSSPVHNSLNTYFLGIGIPQQMSMMSPVPAMPGMIPMYYTPPTTVPDVQNNEPQQPSSSNNTYQPPPKLNITVQCMVYGQPMYGQPIIYPPVTSHPQQQPILTPPLPHTTALNPLGLNITNYEQFQQTTPSTKPSSSSYKQNSSISSKKDTSNDVDKTDGESSYSSFYSSFFKTESDSAVDSDEIKKMEELNENIMMSDNNKFFKPKYIKHVSKKKMEPPWMNQVSVSSELVYKYQISSKKMEEVLFEDQQKMMRLKQPSVVNEQLGQLYLDLHLQGATAKLTLEEGITSSSSSGEESSVKVTKGVRRRAQCNKSMIIYEEDAPMPSPPTTDFEDERDFKLNRIPKS